MSKIPGHGGGKPAFIPVRINTLAGLDPLYKSNAAISTTEDAMQAYLVADTTEKERSSHAMSMPSSINSNTPV